MASRNELGRFVASALAGVLDGAGERLKLFENLAALRDGFDAVHSRRVADAGRGGNANRALRRNLHFRLDDVFRPIAAAGGNIAGQVKNLEATTSRCCARVRCRIRACRRTTPESISTGKDRGCGERGCGRRRGRVLC